MDKFFTLTLSGAVTGGIYSLVASSLVLSYAATGIFNLAYGAIAFSTAVVFFELSSGADVNRFPAAVIAILIFAPLLGLLLDVAVFRPLTKANDTAKIMATVGLLVAIPAATQWIVDLLIESFDVGLLDIDQVFQPPGLGPVPAERWQLPGGARLDSNQLIVLIVAIVVAVALWWMMARSRIGLEMRAVVDRGDLAQLRGVDTRRTSRAAWLVGTTLAGLAGVVAAPVFNALDANVYTTMVFTAAAAGVLGGFRSIPLAFVGGLGLGVAQNWVAGYATFASGIRGFNASVPAVALLIGLVYLGRDRSRRAGGVAEGQSRGDYADDLHPVRRAAPWVVAVGFLIVYAEFLADDFYRGLVVRGLALGLVFLSFTIATGLGGMPTLAQAAFVTTAALTTGLLVNEYDVPFLLAIAGGLAVTIAMGTIVALPALRLGGVALALATFSLAVLGDNVLFAWNWFRNGQQGWRMPRPEYLGIDLANDKTLALVLLAVIGLVVLGIHNLNHSPTGRAAIAVRTSDVAAQSVGISVVRAKLTVFAFAAAVAGLGGILLSVEKGSINNNSYPAQIGLVWLASVVLFGIRRPGAAVIAGLSAALFPTILRSGFHWPGPIPTFLDWDGTPSPHIANLLFGLGAVQLARDPDGILAITGRQNRARRDRRRARRAGIADTGVTAAPAVDGVGAPVVAVGTGLLAVRGLRAGYETVEVLHGIDLDVRGSAIGVVLGPNGAGKSTMCATLAGLLPATGGRVEFDGTDVTGVPAHQRSRLGLVLAPESRGIFPSLTVRENLALWLRDKDAVERALERFPLLKARRRSAAGSLSGGEQQLLTLAPLLVQPPKLLVADEPTLGLAPLVVAEILELASGLTGDGVAVLFVEEKTRDVLGLADDVAFLHLGKVPWRGTRRDEVAAEHLDAVYLGVAETH